MFGENMEFCRGSGPPRKRGRLGGGLLAPTGGELVYGEALFLGLSAYLKGTCGTRVRLVHSWNRGCYRYRSALLQVSLLGRFHVGHSRVLDKLSY